MFMAMYFAGSMALLAYFAYKYLKSKNEDEKKIDIYHKGYRFYQKGKNFGIETHHGYRTNKFHKNLARKASVQLP